MSDLATIINKKIATTVKSGVTTSTPIDIVTTVNETIDALLSIRNSPPGTEILIPEKRILDICRVSAMIFLKQPILLELNAPIVIAGDIHGQYSDLLRLFEINGFPPKANYLFLGDYVDRAKQSTETILLLLCYKIKYARSFFLLRGNHECSLLNKIYGFYDECKRRYSIRVWKNFIDVFNSMPIAAVIEDQIFCAHGGLSPDLHHLSAIFEIQRPIDIKETGLLTDLLWSDPNLDDDASGWVKSPRGVSYMFGKDAIDYFLGVNKLNMIVRAHQVVEDGYEFHHNRKLVTLFSAPNYCGEFDNAGATLLVNENMVCSFKIMRPESHKAKFPLLYPEYAAESESCFKGSSTDDYDDENDGDGEADNTEENEVVPVLNDASTDHEDSVNSLDSIDDTLPVPTDYDSLKATMPNLKISYEDYIKIVSEKADHHFN